MESCGIEIHRRTVERYTYHEDDFSSARGETETLRVLARDVWNVEVRTRTVLTCTPNQFRIWADIDAYEGERRIFCRTWDRSIPRDHV